MLLYPKSRSKFNTDNQCRSVHIGLDLITLVRPLWSVYVILSHAAQEPKNINAKGRYIFLFAMLAVFQVTSRWSRMTLRCLIDGPNCL